MSIVDDVLAGTDALVHLDAALEAAHRIEHRDLLRLCGRRVACLLRHPAGRDWCDDPDLTPVERAAITFTEQYVVDVAGMPDDVVEELRRHLGDVGLVDFVNALLVVEQRLTLELVLAPLVEEAQ